MLFEVAESKNIENLNYQSRLDIFNGFWDAKKNIIGNDSWQKVISVMLNYLNSHKTLTAPVCIFDSVSDSLENPNSVNPLSSLKYFDLNALPLS